jgi:hypothetical protein
MSSALAAGRRNMNIFGVAVIAFVTALGGGPIRELALGRFPIRFLTIWDEWEWPIFPTSRSLQAPCAYSVINLPLWRIGDERPFLSPTQKAATPVKGATGKRLSELPVRCLEFHDHLAIIARLTAGRPRNTA